MQPERIKDQARQQETGEADHVAKEVNEAETAEEIEEQEAIVVETVEVIAVVHGEEKDK